MKIRRLKNLEMLLENISPHPNPKVELEQYSTPANIAADLMWNAYTLGDIKGRNIIDLGCGTGIFSISSLLLDANNALAIDIDKESLESAKKNLTHIDVDSENLKFIEKDICEISSVQELDIKGFNKKSDTLIQNPPFGSQKKGIRHIDRKFIEKEMPELNRRLHYRMLDVSAWKIYFENALGKKFVKPENHRALDDINGSIEELKWYLTFLK